MVLNLFSFLERSSPMQISPATSPTSSLTTSSGVLLPSKPQQSNKGLHRSASSSGDTENKPIIKRLKSAMTAEIILPSSEQQQQQQLPLSEIAAPQQLYVQKKIIVINQ